MSRLARNLLCTLENIDLTKRGHNRFVLTPSSTQSFDVSSSGMIDYSKLLNLRLEATFSSSATVSAEQLVVSSSLDVVEYTKQKLTHEILREVFGEFEDYFEDLRDAILRSDNQAALRLVSQIRKSMYDPE